MKNRITRDTNKTIRACIITILSIIICYIYIEEGKHFKNVLAFAFCGQRIY